MHFFVTPKALIEYINFFKSAPHSWVCLAYNNKGLFLALRGKKGEFFLKQAIDPLEGITQGVVKLKFEAKQLTALNKALKNLCPNTLIEIEVKGVYLIISYDETEFKFNCLNSEYDSYSIDQAILDADNFQEISFEDCKEFFDLHSDQHITFENGAFYCAYSERGVAKIETNFNFDPFTIQGSILKKFSDQPVKIGVFNECLVFDIDKTLSIYPLLTFETFQFMDQMFDFTGFVYSQLFLDHENFNSFKDQLIHPYVIIQVHNNEFSVLSPIDRSVLYSKVSKALGEESFSVTLETKPFFDLFNVSSMICLNLVDISIPVKFECSNIPDLVYLSVPNFRI